MKEGRLVLAAFGVAAVVMIAMPIATILTRTKAATPDQGLDGAITHAFLAADALEGRATSPVAVASVDRLLPKGMPEKTVFETLATSGFTCATDSNAATCFRSYEGANCKDDWTIRLICSGTGTVWSSTAGRQAICV